MVRSYLSPWASWIVVPAGFLGSIANEHSSFLQATLMVVAKQIVSKSTCSGLQHLEQDSWENALVICSFSRITLVLSGFFFFVCLLQWIAMSHQLMAAHYYFCLRHFMPSLPASRFVVAVVRRIVFAD